MEHWLDRLARDLAGARVTRRTVVRRGIGGLAAGGLLGTGWILGRDATGATAAECGLAAAPECGQIATEAGQLAHAACQAEAESSRAACMNGLAMTVQNALAKCLDEKKANSTCSKCELCLGGECIPRCLASCTRCDANTGACVDTCPDGEMCDPRQGDSGVCVPRCPQQCTSYNPITKQCDDSCTEKNPCMVCRQNQCQSNCPDPADFCQDNGVCGHCDASKCQQLVNGKCVGCDATCETCENGQCVSTCSSGQTCCVGQCLRCCQSTCNHATGLCTGTECSASETCCPDGTCADLQGDVMNCGACGHTCNEIEACIQGTCQEDCRAADAPPCADGSMCCPSALGRYACIDISSDPQNCGSCGNECDPGETCSDGICGTGPCHGETCLPSETCCPDGCRDLTNPYNCGQCGNVCPDDASNCVNGACSPCSEPGQTLCGPPDSPTAAALCCDADTECCAYTNTVTGVQAYTCINPSVDMCCQYDGGCSKTDGICLSCGCCRPGECCTSLGLCGNADCV